jgi:hypothetical protein
METLKSFLSENHERLKPVGLNECAALTGGCDQPPPFPMPHPLPGLRIHLPPPSFISPPASR